MIQCLNTNRTWGGQNDSFVGGGEKGRLKLCWIGFGANSFPGGSASADSRPEGLSKTAAAGVLTRLVPTGHYHQEQPWEPFVRRF